MPHTFSTMPPDPPMSDADEPTSHPGDESPAPPSGEIQAATGPDRMTEQDSDAPAPPPDRPDDHGTAAEADTDAPSPPDESEQTAAETGDGQQPPLPPDFEDAAIAGVSGEPPPLPPD